MMTRKMKQVWQMLAVPLSAALFFVAVCLCSSPTAKRTALLLIPLTLAAAILCYSRLRDRIRQPLPALALVVLAGGLSTLYAVSGRFALFEFLKLLNAFCLTLLLFVLVRGTRSAQRIGSILSGCMAIAGVVSIDLLSTRLISTPVLAFLERLGCGFSKLGLPELGPIEEGIRMNGIFITPNVFAGCAGIAVLLGLGLAANAASRAERAAQLVCLSINSLAFTLVFSMGGSGTIVLAFLAYLLLETRGNRIDRLILMSETLVVTLLMTFPISQTSFSEWTVPQPVPLLCLIAGAILLCLLDAFVGRRLAEKLRGRGKALPLFLAGVFAVLAVLIAAACSLTGGVTLQAGETLRRSAYPAPGDYTIAATIETEGEGELSLTVESQNAVETQMHTGTVLYSGPLSGAAFTVPEGSLVVYFTFSAPQTVRLEQASCQGSAGTEKIPLGYPLLPGFIANRLQGLRANENAIQRLTFFKDGLKLFRRSPLIGLGLGSFETSRAGVQSFSYSTYYVHNHYIQTLDETGIIGLLLFLGLLVISAAAVWRTRQRNALIPALGAALVFMAGHAFVEVVFSTYCYLPMAFGVFGMISLCSGDAVPSLTSRKQVRSVLLIGCMVLLLAFELLLCGNVMAGRLTADRTQSPERLERLERAARLDRFEWPEHLLNYLMESLKPDTDAAIREKADGYAQRLASVYTDKCPRYLAEYYLYTDRLEPAFEAAKRFVTYAAANRHTWQETFELLEKYEQDTPEYRAGVAEIVQMLADWNAQNLGTIQLTEENEAFLARMAG